jgi:hypothetical protein
MKIRKFNMHITLGDFFLGRWREYIVVMRCKVCHVQKVLRNRSSISNSLANLISQILLFANSQNNMGKKKRSHLQQFGKFRFQEPKSPAKKRRGPLSERRAPRERPIPSRCAAPRRAHICADCSLF